LAVLPGVVVSVANTPHGGNNFIIRHDNGLHTYYAHCDQIFVREGERVKRLQQIATVGATGSPNPGTTFIDPHLHMQVQAKQSFQSEHYNPLDFLDALGIEARDATVPAGWLASPLNKTRVMYWKEGYSSKTGVPKAKPGPGLTLLGIGLGAGLLFWWKARVSRSVRRG
jgi:murein DD-endopeptidase MepM/ murein hydrolase activator NlpD